MSHRTQITLSNSQYDTLRADSKESGLSIAELVRRALDKEYSSRSTLEEKLRIIDETAGSWKRAKSFDPAEEVKKLRRPLGPMPKR